MRAAVSSLLFACALGSASCGGGGGGDETRPGPGDYDTSYGNSAQGRWINDELGLPAFRYEGCADSPCTGAALDTFHQLGNGHATAIAHSDGYVELFTAKSFYRFANRWDEAGRNYAGGFGWVRDGDDVWSTLFEDRPPGAIYERVFGMGYFKKTVEKGGLRVEQWIYFPPGSDEVLRERLVFTNTSGEAKSIDYFDYWDVAWWLLRHSDPITDTSIWDPAAVRTSWDAERSTLAAASLAAPGDADVPSLTDDPSPKTSFVTFLDEAPDRWDTVQGTFFGAGDRAVPERVAAGGLSNGLDDSGSLANQDAVLVTQKRIAIAPGESRELNLLFGIAPRDEAAAVIDRLRGEKANLLPDLARDWAARIPRVRLPDDRWIDREMAWSTYYLLSGMLREDWFDTRVINQGSIYLYDWGANAGPRAALRHLLPVVYLDPAAARDVLVYYLRAMRPDGELSYATAGHGGWQPFGFEPSDSSLWLLWAAAEYVFATRDFAFLDETHDWYCDAGRGRCGSATAWEMLKQAFVYQVDVVATGPHGLVRLLDSDWDDFLTSFSSDVDPARTEELGESTMNTAIALVGYPMFADLAERRGETAYAASVRTHADALASVLGQQWRGDFFNRAYVYTRDDEPIEVGAENLWLASNGLALVADGVLSPDRAERLVARMRNDLFEASTLGLASQGAPITPSLGVAGFWYSLAGPALEGLLLHRDVPGARALAWDAFRQQTLAGHAEAYPEIWYGTWSGPDMFFTPIDAAPPSSQPGETWCFAGVLCMRDFPVANAFAHSEALLGSVRFAGLRADAEGLVVDPAFPFSDFEWSSPAFAVSSAPDETRGAITALGDDVIALRVRLPSGSDAKSVQVQVDGKAAGFSVDGGFARFEVPVRRDVAVAWSVRTGS